jgi:hypothetical protein
LLQGEHVKTERYCDEPEAVPLNENPTEVESLESTASGLPVVLLAQTSASSALFPDAAWVLPSGQVAEIAPAAALHMNVPALVVIEKLVVLA